MTVLYVAYIVFFDSVYIIINIFVVYVWVTKGTSIERVCVCHVNVNHYKYRH